MYDSFHRNFYTPKIHQNQKLRFLGISRCNLKLRFWFNLNMYRAIWVSGFGGFWRCSIFCSYVSFLWNVTKEYQRYELNPTLEGAKCSLTHLQWHFERSFHKSNLVNTLQKLVGLFSLKQSDVLKCLSEARSSKVVGLFSLNRYERVPKRDGRSLLYGAK